MNAASQIPLEHPVVYVPSNELTRKPVPVGDWDDLSWRLPPQAHGTVILTIYISSTGTVNRFEFGNPVSSELHEWISGLLMKGAPFMPGERQGIPVPTRMTIELDLSSMRR